MSKWRSEQGFMLDGGLLDLQNMDMLDYCKTYTMVKSIYTNQEPSEHASQEGRQTTAAQQKYDNNGECAVQSLSTTPADLPRYSLVTEPPKELYETGEDKLSPLKDVGRNKGIIPSINMKTHQRVSFESELTFAPKLNALSIKLAKERCEKVRSVAERRNSSSSSVQETNFTFKPKVSSNSVRIMQHLKTTFMDRQQLHVEKQKRYIEATINSYQSRGHFSPVPSVKSPTRLKKIPKIKAADSQEGNLDEEQHLPSDSLTPPEVLGSTSAPELMSTPVMNKSSGGIPGIHSSSSCDTTNSNNLTSLSSTDITKKNSKVKFPEKISSKSDEACKKMQETSPYNESTENLYLKKHVVKRSVVKTHKRSLTHPSQKPSEAGNSEASWDDSTKVENKSKTKGSHSRSQSQPFGYNSQPAGKLKYEDPVFDKVRHARQVAETAIKQKKVFICHGPYPIVRATLRKRGYVEKHYRENLVSPKSKKNDSDDSEDDSCDSGDDSDNQTSANQSPRGKENNTKAGKKTVVSKSRKLSVTGTKVGRNKNDDESCSDNDSDDENVDEDWNAGYEAKGAEFEFSLMSRSVRNAVASFIWTTKRDDVDFKFLRKDQIVNHYCKAHSFTTKVGLTTNLRNLRWYEDADHFTFFPRSHLLGSEEEKMDFIDDYRLTAAISIVKWVTQRHEKGNTTEEKPSHRDKDKAPQATDSDQDRPRTTSSMQRRSASSRAASRGSSNVVPLKALTLALEACQEYLRCNEHLDIDDDVNKDPAITEESWDQLVEYYYQVKLPGTIIASSHPYLKECQNTLKQIKECLPQVDIDGVKNIWIVKPGAKSRGRGITCMDRLDDILKLVGTTIGKKEGRLVVQKYIERPLLIHGVKFDIRQWFLVTDWNPLTMWFYQDCYFRFCSQNFSLDDYHISIHLANNSIQKHFENNSMRDKRIPEENMWSSDNFKDYLKRRGVGNMWEEVIYPGMRKAVIYAMQSCQEIVEYRKNSFELYGADFIISDDYKPWLLEINCSPTMGPSTAITRKLCAAVLEDTMKVVLDRREDKNCDTGRYELAFKQPLVSAPPYIGMNMAIEGQGIRRAPVQVKRQHDITSPRVVPLSRPKEATPESLAVRIASLSRPKETRNVITNSSEESKDTKRHDLRGKDSTRKPDGSWAVGYMGTPQAIPVATTFCTTDDGKLKSLIARSRTGYSSEVDVSTHTQGPRAMKIPTAVLKYSGDTSMKHSTPLPISIGPDNSVKHF